jgi:hypothetical protein
MSRRITFFGFLLLLPFFIFGGTAGRLKGKVTDIKTGEPLIGANVVVVGTSLGAQTDSKGEFAITNLVAGTYSVKCSFIGYQSVTMQGFRINADLTAELNFQLPLEGLSVKAIEVVASRPLVNKNATNANRITTSEDIQALPVRGVNNILSLTPGVVLQDGAVYVRGGRSDEVGYYLEGASISDPMTGNRGVSISQDAIEEIQVQAGGYNAEYGGANAGIIYTQIKSGTPSLKATAEWITDNVTFKSSKDRFDGQKRLGAYWYGYSDFTGTVGGPILTDKVKFFGLFNYNYQNDVDPQNFPGIALGKITDPTSGASVDLNYNAGAEHKNSQSTMNGTASLTIDLKPVILRAIGTYTANTSYNNNYYAIQYMLDENRIEKWDTKNGATSLKATWIISPQTFVEVSGGFSFNTRHRYDPLLMDNYLAYGDSAANAKYGTFQSTYVQPTALSMFDFSFAAPGTVVSAYQKFKRYRYNLTAAFSTQWKEHSLKIGGEYQQLTIRNYSMTNRLDTKLAGLFKGVKTDSLKQLILRQQGINNYGYDEFGNESDANEYTKAKEPVFASAYIQDKIEYKDLVINAGLRYDYIDVDNLMMVDPTRPDKSINQADGNYIVDKTGPRDSGWVKTPKFQSLCPRLGFSFPITDRTVFHAQYGKFIQQTRLQDMYTGIYNVAYNLIGQYEITTPVGYNIRPTKTTQYEIGFTQQIGEIASVDFTGYYKDIIDQVVFDKQTVVAGHGFQDYNILKNGDFATTKGVEIAFNLRRIERIQASANISFNDASGTGSNPYSGRGIVGAPLDGVTIFKPQYVEPLDFNNSFRGNFNIDYRFGKNDGPKWTEDLGISALATFNSGHPFTLGKGGADLEGDARTRQPIEALNSSTTPWQFQVDLRIDKTFTIYDKLNANIYIYVINVFNIENILNVFLRTGSTKDDGYLSDPSLGGTKVATYGTAYEQMYRAININYYEQYRSDTGLDFYGAPRQIRLGVRLEY